MIEVILLAGSEPVRKLTDTDGEVWLNAKELIESTDKVVLSGPVHGKYALRGYVDALRALVLGTPEEELIERAHRDGFA